MTFYSLSAGFLEKEHKQIAKLAKSQNSNSRSKRSIASVPLKLSEKPDLSDLSEFYFSRHRELMKRGKKEEAIKMLGRVQQYSSDSEMQMRSSFFAAEYYCKKGNEKECLKQIDHMVSLSPESLWSGRALVLLAKYYSDHNKLPELLLVKDVVYEQFKKHPDIINSLNRLNL